jgi:hypothetical protein
MRGKPAVLKRADSRIRLFCRRLTGKQRIVLTSVVSLLFTAACGGAGNFSRNLNRTATKAGGFAAGTGGAVLGNIGGRLRGK